LRGRGPRVTPAKPKAKAAAKALSLRALNRATLARQMLLERAKVLPVKAVEALAGLQAQAPRPPFVGLWTRLQQVRAEDVLAALENRERVRAPAMRGTLHLLSAKHYRQLRAALQPALTAGLKSILRERFAVLDLKVLAEAARELYAERPRPFDDVRDAL